jgi:hypothetical protein
MDDQFRSFTSRIIAKKDIDLPSVVGSLPRRGRFEMSPMCEQCGAPMVQKKAMRGTNAGNSFWGCSQWKQGENHSTYIDADGSADTSTPLGEV